MPHLEHDRLLARPLADLHMIAGQLGIERFRLLRKPELVDAIRAAQPAAAHARR